LSPEKEILQMKPYLFAAAALYAAAFLSVIAHHASRSKALEKASRWVLVLGLLAHTGGLIQRIVSTGHAPMASMYETLVFFSWTTVLVSAIVVFRYAERETELVTLPVSILAIVFALLNEKPGGPLTLVLRTRWFETHVTASFAGYALFTLAFAGAAVYLVKKWKGREEGELRKFQEIAGKSILWGFFFFSAAMFAGESPPVATW
jgi:ABC-type transport system involved in cytochrome c biogenesis permease subunit